MANGKNEAECRTCGHHVWTGNQTDCKLHHFRIPTERGPYLICQDWVCQSDRTRELASPKEKFLAEPGILYQYHPYSTGPGIPIAKFSELDPVDFV